MRQVIPAPVIAVVSEIVSERESHATLDSLFMYAGAPGEPPAASKHAKAMEWLRRTNKDQSVEPFRVLGSIIEGYMDEDPDSSMWGPQKSSEFRNKISQALERGKLQYYSGGKVTGSLGTPTLSLEQHIRNKNIESVNDEFSRALETVESQPRQALSAACNILEAVFKVYIESEELEMPSKKDVKSTWNVIRKHLNFDPKYVEDRDLQEILSGMASIVGGVGALRTHASTAHGRGSMRYRIQPRHARLAAHAAHTLALFVLETWDARR